MKLDPMKLGMGNDLRKRNETFDDVMIHLRRDESRLYVVYYVCMLYLFRHRSIYSFLIEVYLHLSSKYIFFHHRSITPIAEAILSCSKINRSGPQKASGFGENAPGGGLGSEIEWASRVIF